MPARLTIAIIAAVSIAAAGVQSAAANHGTLRLISIGPGGGNGPLPADFRDATPDGSHVFFQSVESLLPGDTDTTLDVYERVGDVTTLISTGPSGGNGAAHASYGGATPDGSRIYFTTTERLVPGDLDFATDVYERFGDVTTLVSTSATDPQNFRSARFNAVSTDGAHVFFTTTERLDPGDQDGFEDVYERSSGNAPLRTARTSPPFRHPPATRRG